MRTNRLIQAEVIIVLSLSLLASATYSVIDHLTRPLTGPGSTVATYSSAGFALQFAQIVFGLAPVALVLYLIARGNESSESFGMGRFDLRTDLLAGSAVAAAVATVGGVVYVVASLLHIGRPVIPAPPPGHWWTLPVLLLGAIAAGLLEEVVGVSYLVTRMEQLGRPTTLAVLVSALLRGTYHLYQGWGAFAGNLILGVAFAWGFVRLRRTWMLVTAHALVDILAGGAYLLLRGQCVLGVCVR